MKIQEKNYRINLPSCMTWAEARPTQLKVEVEKAEGNASQASLLVEDTANQARLPAVHASPEPCHRQANANPVRLHRAEARQQASLANQERPLRAENADPEDQPQVVIANRATQQDKNARPALYPDKPTG